MKTDSVGPTSDGPRLRVVNCSDITDPQWCWVSKAFASCAQDWRHFSAQPGWMDPLPGRPYFARFRATWQAVAWAAAGPSILVAHLPRFAWQCAEIARLRRVEAPILAFAFNFTDLPTGLRRRRMTRALQRVDRFAVFSTCERELYSDWLKLDPGRIDIVHWGVAPPPHDPAEQPLERGEYACAVGGNARDYPTLVESMRKLPEVRLVLVARPENLHGLDLPPNVTPYTNIPLGQVYNLMRHSRFMALPLRDAQVPCGHVTIVSAMYMARAIAATDSRGIADYVRHGDNALLVPPRDPAALAEAIRTLWRDPELCAQLGERSLRFAQTHCSESATVAYFARYLQSKGLLSLGEFVDIAPPEAAAAAPAVMRATDILRTG